MTQRGIVAFAIVLMLMRFGGAAAQGAQLAVNAQNTHQTIDGFGTAMAWWLDHPEKPLWTEGRDQ